jgi:hypothetical protein
MHMSTSPCDFGHRLHRLLPSSLEWNDSEVHRVSGAGFACWLSVPVGFGSLEVPSAQGFRRDTANDHSCCPRSHPRISPILFLSINSTAMPCGEQHPCCVRQAPSNPSTMPVETKAIRPAPERVLALVTDAPCSGRSRITGTSAICSLPPPMERSTVLRI